MNKSYKELKAENENLKLECNRLLKENKELRERLKINSPNVVSVRAETNHIEIKEKVNSNSTLESYSKPKDKEINKEYVAKETAYGKNSINKYSNSKEKIKLFISLFKGREDVYASRWESKNGKKGYTPVCRNQWKDGLCMKPKIKCSDCDNRLLKRFDEEVVLEHLLGKQIFGIYPLLKDETCNFLAIDFDKSNWMEDVNAFVETCKENDIPIGIERSRSGNGAHVWIFFSQPIKASTARKLGSFLLTYTMERRYEVGLDSYDRLFPNQDTMPKGGFGNLIALPLQKAPRENGNSVFVDESFITYEDQWSFLFNLKKMDLKEVEGLIKVYEEIQNENEQLSLKNDKIQVTKKVRESSEDIKVPEIVEIVLKNMIFIKKEGFPSKIITKLIRTATFSNPEFYKAQAMRLSTYNKPRIINCSEVRAKYVCGLTATLVRKDGHHPIITMQCGEIRHKVNYKDISSMKEIEHVVIESKTKFKYCEYEEGKTKITELYSAIINDIRRNDKIFNDVLKSLEEKRSPVLLTERRAHIDYFEERFKGFVKNIVVLKGGMGKKQREAVREQLNNIPENEERLIIASGKYIGEGFDDSRLDTLFLVMPISWKGTLQQYAGRLHRNHHNKKVVKIHDYVDEEIPMLKRMFDKRIKGYKNMGYDIMKGENNE